MNLAARSQRIVKIHTACLLIGLLASACSSNMSVLSGSDNLVHDTDMAVSREDLPGGDSTTLMEFARNGIGIEVVRRPEYARVMLTTAQQDPAYEISEQSSPRRLVLDIPGSKTDSSEIFPIIDSPFLSQLALGSADGSDRVVLQIPEDRGTVDAQVDLIDGAIVVTLSEDSLELSPISGETAEIMAAPEMPPVPQETEETAVENDQTSADWTDRQPGTVAAPLDMNSVVTGIEIDQIDSVNNQVIATVTSAGKFTVRKSAATEYVVTLEGARLGEGTQSALVAGPVSGAIRSVRPVQQGENVMLRVFTRPGTIITAQAKNGKVFVMPTSVTDTLEDGGPLAQLADPSASGDADIASLLEGEQLYTGRLISLDLQDTDIDNALRIIAEVSNLNIIASDDVTGKVTLRLIDVPWDQALDVILKTNGLDKVQELNVIRVAPVEKLRAEREALKDAEQAKILLEPLLVRYIRISYAKATEIKPLVDTVLTERGTAAVDERTNQVIVKDIQDGIQKVAELVKKLDLRTPQVLLETQIVEAQRSFLRDLGMELGFDYIQSPATGNPTDYNFPNSIQVAGAVEPGSTLGSSFPAAVTSAAGSAVSALFGSADGTKNLNLRLTSLESDGRVRIVSRPSVATVNNKEAIIKSVEKIRVKLPSSGLSVATGQGAVAQGGASAATESFEVGITLEVTPQASPDYYVLLDINAKSSTLGSTFVDGIPSEVERSATSTVLVSSGQTFALGGIYKLTDQDTVDGVPFFKDIPVLGHLFRRALVDNGDEELIFFITPRIVEGSFDDAAMRASF